MGRLDKENGDVRYYLNGRDLNYAIEHIINEANSRGIFNFYNIKHNHIYYFLSSIFDGVKSPYELSDLGRRIENCLHPNQINSLIRIRKIRNKIENNLYRNTNNFFSYDTFLDEDDNIDGNIRFFIKITSNMSIDNLDSSKSNNEISGRSVVFVYSYPKIISIDEYNISIYPIDENKDLRDFCSDLKKLNLKNLPFCIISSTKEGVEIRYTFWNAFSNQLEEKIFCRF